MRLRPRQANASRLIGTSRLPGHAGARTVPIDAPMMADAQ